MTEEDISNGREKGHTQVHRRLGPNRVIEEFSQKILFRADLEGNISKILKLNHSNSR